MRSHFKETLICMVFALGIFMISSLVYSLNGHAQDFQLRVLDPRGELYSNPATPINPRLNTLAGKKIGILNNTKPGADSFLPYMMQVLKESYPTVEFKEWKIPYNDYPNKANELKALAAWSDGVIGMLGD